MHSNFLGDPGEVVWRGIISSNELLSREGVDLRKGMNFRKAPQRPSGERGSTEAGRSNVLSVFLSLPSHEGEYRDEWREREQLYVYEGHDSTTVEGGKAKDQLMMYESGRLSENGKFYKAAHAFKDGLESSAMQIQVYEKLGPGVWFDKGIFNLVDAERVSDQRDGSVRKVFKFFLQPADALDPSSWDRYRAERFLPVTAKVEAWTRSTGRCEECGSESDLHFTGTAKSVGLYCARHASRIQ